MKKNIYGERCNGLVSIIFFMLNMPLPNFDSSFTQFDQIPFCTIAKTVKI